MEKKIFCTRFWLISFIAAGMLCQLFSGGTAAALTQNQYAMLEEETSISGTSSTFMYIDFNTYVYRAGSLTSQAAIDLTNATKVIIGNRTTLSGRVGSGTASRLELYNELALDGRFTVAEDGTVQYYYWFDDEWLTLAPGEARTKTFSTTTYGGFSGELIVTHTVANHGIQSKLKITAPGTSYTPVAKVGDVNVDEVINIVDALLVAQLAAGQYPRMQMGPADVDGNGTIDIIDALTIARYAVGLITQFPRTTP